VKVGLVSLNGKVLLSDHISEVIKELGLHAVILFTGKRFTMPSLIDLSRRIKL
jgi:hypothetical protein